MKKSYNGLLLTLTLLLIFTISIAKQLSYLPNLHISHLTSEHERQQILLYEASFYGLHFNEDSEEQIFSNAKAN